MDAITSEERNRLQERGIAPMHAAFAVLMRRRGFACRNCLDWHGDRNAPPYPHGKPGLCLSRHNKPPPPTGAYALGAVIARMAGEKPADFEMRTSSDEVCQHYVGMLPRDLLPAAESKEGDDE